MVSQLGMLNLELDAQLIADVSQDSRVEVSILRSKANLIITEFLLDVCYPPEEIGYYHIYRTAR